nr:hypothetical protein [Tanacetum cinerariifolium]
MEDTMLEVIKICHQKELLCIHDNVDDLIESALKTKLLSINSQHLDKEKQEVKNVVEQPAERGNRIESLQNFRVIYKSSISLKNTSQISLIHAIATILSTKEPEYSSSMGYEHLSITPETKSDEVTESNAENLLPIPKIVSVEEENDVNQEEEEIDLGDISQIQDVVLREKLLSITRLISNIESLNDNPIPDYHTEETRSDNTTTHADNSLPEYDSVCFEIETDRERLIYVVKNDIFDDSSNDLLLEEADLFLSDNSIPPGIENVADDLEGDIQLPDVETDVGEEISVVMNNKDKFEEDYHFFMFDKVFSLLSAESEDTIFDPGFYPQ